MPKRLFTALVCAFAVAGQMRAQEVVVARDAKPNASDRATTTASERADAESVNAPSTKSQTQKKKSVSTSLTVEQMRKAGALAAEQQKNPARVVQTSTIRTSSSQLAQAEAPKAFRTVEPVKKENRVERASASRASNSRDTKSGAIGPVRPTMIESEKEEPAAPRQEKADAGGGQTSAPQSANQSSRKQETIVAAGE